MIDDERLQELLAKASSLYNNGEYKGAIEAWREALTVDPASQRAQEGIRMATLLMGDWEAPSPAVPAEETPEPADGSGDPALSADEQEAKVDLGIARVKQLIAQRKFSEAMEGARGLLPLSPDSEEIQRLLEEAQQAFESTPFIDEHLTLAKELMAQERYPEAETECKKIFVLDATHPEGRALLTQIREKIQSHLKRAADQLGGMTVKLKLPTAPKAEPPKRTAFEGEVVLDGDDAPPIALVDAKPPAHGSEAARQEEVAARSVLDAAFDQAGFGAAAAPADRPEAAEPVEARASGVDLAFEGGALDGETGKAAEAPAEPEVVEAKTVVPPTARVVARPPAAGETKPAAAEARPAAAETKPSGPAPASTAARPVTQSASPDETAWETELTQLNIKQGQREIMRGTPLKASGASSPGNPADVDLMSLLDTDIGGPPAAEAPREGAPAGGEKGGHAPGSPSGKAVKVAPEKHGASGEAVQELPRPALKERTSPSTAARERAKALPLPAPKPRSTASRIFTILAILLLAGAAAGWWFFFQPRAAGGAGSPERPGSKQAPEAPVAAAGQAENGIPTPIGSTSRQPSQEARGASANVGAAPPAGQDGGGPPAGQAAATAQGASPGAGAGDLPRPTEPIKPAAATPLSPEEIRRKVAAFTEDGRKLMAQSKWREARAKLSAALALDAANFDVKDLLDRTQAKIDEQQHIDDDFESARKFYADKDYENALRKFYRLPRDKGLGDIDVYIRNSWFNWAVVSMKAGNATDALLKLKELLDVDPSDAQALKLQEVAEHYATRPKDRVFYAFTDTLHLRAFDQK